MSIISEALKKANAERQLVDRPVAHKISGRAGRVVTTVCVLALVITPFLFPRVLSRFSSAGNTVVGSVTDRPSIGLADAPEIKHQAGMAQIAVESRDLNAIAGPAPIMSSVEPTLTTAKAGTFILQGTVWTQNKGRYAILNTNVVREGSMIGDYRVESIGDGQITLNDGTQKLTIDKSL